MNVVIAIYCGHVNQEGFRTWEEARKWVESRIPQEAKNIQKTYTGVDAMWNCLQYEDRKGNTNLWQLVEVRVNE